jgi:hypothetical protein
MKKNIRAGLLTGPQTATVARGRWPQRFGSRQRPPRFGGRPHWPSAASGGGRLGSGGGPDWPSAASVADGLG